MSRRLSGPEAGRVYMESRNWLVSYGLETIRKQLDRYSREPEIQAGQADQKTEGDVG